MNQFLIISGLKHQNFNSGKYLFDQVRKLYSVPYEDLVEPYYAAPVGDEQPLFRLFKTPPARN